MGRDLGMSLGDLCRWLYILSPCSVLTSYLCEAGRRKLNRAARDAEDAWGAEYCTQGGPAHWGDGDNQVYNV